MTKHTDDMQPAGKPKVPRVHGNCKSRKAPPLEVLPSGTKEQLEGFLLRLEKFSTETYFTLPVLGAKKEEPPDLVDGNPVDDVEQFHFTLFHSSLEDQDIEEHTANKHNPRILEKAAQAVKLNLKQSQQNPSLIKEKLGVIEVALSELLETHTLKLEDKEHKGFRQQFTAFRNEAKTLAAGISEHASEGPQAAGGSARVA